MSEDIPPEIPDNPPPDSPDEETTEVKPLIIETRDANVTEAMQASLDTLQKKITEQDAIITELTNKNTNIQKSALIEQIEKAGYDVEGFDKHDLKSLEAIALTLSQTSKSIVIKNKKKEESRGVEVYDPNLKRHVKFYERNSEPPKS